MVMTGLGVVWLGSLVSAAGGPPARQAGNLPVSRGADIAETCLACHGTGLIVQQRLSRDAWMREVDKMIGWGAVVADADKAILVDYLARHFGAGPPTSDPPPAAEPGATLLASRCLACHGRDLIEQQRLDADGWSREVDKMIGWGAVLTPDDKSALVNYLSSGSWAAR
jgi:cytochrome c553